MGSGNPNSSPHPCKASTLPTTAPPNGAGLSSLETKMQYSVVLQHKGTDQQAPVSTLKHCIFICIFICFILCIWVFYLLICTCTACMPSARGDQKRASESLEMELQMVVNDYMVLRTKHVLCKSKKHS